MAIWGGELCALEYRRLRYGHAGAGGQSLVSVLSARFSSWVERGLPRVYSWMCWRAHATRAVQRRHHQVPRPVRCI